MLLTNEQRIKCVLLAEAQHRRLQSAFWWHDQTLVLVISKHDSLFEQYARMCTGKKNNQQEKEKNQEISVTQMLTIIITIFITMLFQCYDHGNFYLNRRAEDVECG